MRSSTPTADTRAAHAALARLTVLDQLTVDRYLLIDDGDEDMTDIRTILPVRSPRGLDVQP